MGLLYLSKTKKIIAGIIFVCIIIILTLSLGYTVGGWGDSSSSSNNSLPKELTEFQETHKDNLEELKTEFIALKYSEPPNKIYPKDTIKSPDDIISDKVLHKRRNLLNQSTIETTLLNSVSNIVNQIDDEMKYENLIKIEKKESVPSDDDNKTKYYNEFSNIFSFN